jgi:hypothetical protein
LRGVAINRDRILASFLLGPPFFSGDSLRLLRGAFLLRLSGNTLSLFGRQR